MSALIYIFGRARSRRWAIVAMSSHSPTHCQPRGLLESDLFDGLCGRYVSLMASRCCLKFASETATTGMR